MGQTFMGSNAKQVGKAQLMSPEQQKFLNSLISGVGGDVQGAFPGLLQGYNEDTFQKGVVDPAMKTYEQQILPGIEQRFTDANAGSSSALTQALAQSSNDLSNTLAGQRIGYQQMAGNQQLGALQQILSLLSQRSFDPIVQGPQKGLVSDLISAGGMLGGAYLLSSQKAKTNIKPYLKGLDTIVPLEVKQYDYTVEVDGPAKDRVGIIAETLPAELTAEINGMKVVDLYGLVSTLINCVQELNSRLVQVEGTKCQ